MSFLDDNRINRIIKYYPWLTENDVEKVYQRSEQQGLYLFEMDPDIIPNLELFNQNTEEIIKLSTVQNSIFPNYFNDFYNIIFLPSSVSNIQPLSQNRIIDENNLQNTLSKYKKITPKNIIHQIYYHYDRIVETFNIYAKIFPNEINSLVNSSDPFIIINKKLKSNSHFFSEVEKLINDNLFTRLNSIIQQYHSIVHGIHGLKDRICRAQFDSIKEMDPKNIQDFIEKRNKAIEKLISNPTEGEKIIIQHLQLKKIIQNGICNDFKWAIKKDQQCPEDLMLDYMPEFKKDPQPENRQVVLGDLDEISQYTNCSSHFISDEFVIGKYGIPYVSWSPELNKVFMQCITEKKLIFPIRYISSVGTTGRYKSFPKNYSHLLYCGMLVVPLIGHCFYMRFNPKIFNYYGDNMSTHLYFIYLDTKTLTYSAYNYRGNLVGIFYGDAVSRKNFMEEIKFSYIELNILHYTPRMKVYQYKNEPVYFFSKYAKDEIYQLYTNKYQSISAKQIIDNLTEINLVKNPVTKLFELRSNKEKNYQIEEIKNKIRKRIKSIENFNKKPFRKPEIYYGYESRRDIKKMVQRIDQKYIYQSFPQTKIHYDSIINNLPNDLIVFSEYGAVLNNPVKYNQSLIYLKDIKFLEKIKKIIDEYQPNKTLNEILKENFEKTIKEPSKEDVEKFLKERQKELESVRGKQFYKNLELNKLEKTDGCNSEYIWSDVDIPSRMTTKTCNRFDNGTYPFLKQYYPERLVAENKLYQLRPTILGFLSDQKKFDECQKYFRTKFTIDKEKANLKYFNWSYDLNRAFIQCTLNNSKLIFPFALIDPEFDKIGRYSTFYPNKQYEYVGILSIPFIDTRNDKHPIQKFIFYIFKEFNHADYQLVIFNHRQNRITPGAYFEQYRVVYVELNQIYYYKEKINIYLYRPSTLFSKKIYLFSKFNKKEIQNIYLNNYHNLYTKNEIKAVIDDIVPVQFVKDPKTKIFKFYSKYKHE